MNDPIDVALVTLNDDIAELEDLSSSAGHHIVFEVIQRRARPCASTFVGKGKLEDLKELLQEHPVNAVLVNGDLKPSQHYLLESELGVQVIDRIRLVLNIFESRAFSREAQLQVLRAKLLYEIPLLREWIHNAKSGEHPGFLGAGEYETDAYYELIRRQLSRIDSELAKLAQDQDLRRQQRRKRGFYTVALAGYTNAGKSSMLNALTREKALVEDRMFSTLSTTTGRLDGVNKQVLLTDTIGFLRNLPPFLIESFKSTTDEIFSADLVLLIIDSSDPESELVRKVDTSIRILFPEVDATNLIVVLNKIDRTTDLPRKLQLIATKVPCRAILCTSARTQEGLDAVHQAIVSNFSYPCEMRFHLPHTSEVDSLVSWLYDHTEVDAVDYSQGVSVSLHCQEKDHLPLVHRIVKLGGTALQDEVPSGDAMLTRS